MDKCFSYAMGIGNKMEKLDKDRFIINEDDGDYEVTFDKDDVDTWEQFIIDNMECGYWNDYIVDDEIVIIFKESNGEINKYILSKDNNQELLKKFCLFAETEFSSVREMYLDTPFYRNKIERVIFFD